MERTATDVPWHAPGDPGPPEALARAAAHPLDARAAAGTRPTPDSNEPACRHTPIAAAGVTYPLAATGELAYALYWRTLPWDHAPGALLAEEAGLTVAAPRRHPLPAMGRSVRTAHCRHSCGVGRGPGGPARDTLEK